MMLKSVSAPTFLFGALVLIISNTRGEPIRGSSSSVTTLKPESGVLDDPVNPATGIYGSNPICLRCYEKVEAAERTVELHDELSKKYKILGKRMIDANQARTNDRNRSPKANSSSLTTMTRSLEDNPGHIIVSRLRVRRSPDGSRVPRRLPTKEKHLINKKDEYERVKVNLQAQKEKACKVLFEVHECLEELQNECIGDLYFHSYEVYFDQIWARLLCPSPYLPNVKPMPVLQLEPRNWENVDRIPQARPMAPTPDEVRRRIHQMLPDRPHPSALVELKQQPPVQRSGSFRHLPVPQHINTMDPLMVARVILVPTCLIVLVLTALLAAIHYKRGRDQIEDDCDEKDEKSDLDRSFFTVV